MTKQTWKKLLAFAMSLIMMGSLITPILPTAQAAGEGLAVLSDTGGTGTGGTGGGVGIVSGGEEKDFWDIDVGRPNLYVDFLGDNKGYRADHNGAAPDNVLVAPGTYDQSKLSNPTGTGNRWEGYNDEECVDGTIFWVGLGLDRTEIFSLLEDEKGLASLEAGFYYNDRYIEPYTGESGDFAATITAANILKNSTDNLHWSDAYTIRQAVTDLPLTDHSDPNDPIPLPGVSDELTRESMINPSVEEILQATVPEGTPEEQADNWRMTYVSLELTNMANAKRLADRYDRSYFIETHDDTEDPGVGTEEPGETTEKKKYPDAATGDNGPEYLLLIPFRLKRYDEDRRLCLRLIRDATHFSIGAGQDGADPYAAWERVTTRNLGRDLKTLTRFTGDLNIFTGKKMPEKYNEDWTYRATLKIVNGGDSRNYAKLGLADDPSLNPVYVDKNNAYISNLKDGTGMQVSTRVQPGYSVSVHVYEVDETGATIVHQVVTENADYRFVMPKMPQPKQNVLVVVKFEKADFEPEIFLSELPVTVNADGSVKLKPRKEGNETSIEPGGGLDIISSFDRVVTGSHDGLHADDSSIVHADGPSGPGKAGETVTVRVGTHANYEARVRIYNFIDMAWMTQGITIISPSNGRIETDGTVVLPRGGVLEFTMPKSNIDVEVTYTEATVYTAYLEVYHEETDPYNHDDMNTAQLAYDDYGDDNVRITAYSAQVYEEHDKTTDPETVDHRAIKEDSHVIAWVPASAAALSGSLGGDGAGAENRAWSSTDVAGGASAIMSLLYSAADANAFSQNLRELNHSTIELIPGVNGFRRNFQGETYGDAQLYFATPGDVIGLANAMWEMRTRILNDAPATGSSLSDDYVKTVMNTEDTPPTVAFTYFDLTPAQVQAYILEMLEAEDLERTNALVYREAYYAYQDVRKDFVMVDSSAVSNDVTPPIAPMLPRSVQVDDTTGVRKYEGKDYNEVYLKSYMDYMDAYKTYITDLIEGTGDENVHAYAGVKPNDDLPKMVTASILDDTAARQKITDQKWKTATPSKQNYVRDGRQVWVALEANSAYEEMMVELWRADVNGQASVLLNTLSTPADGYRNVYSFTMPNEDCVVRVTYKTRDTIKLDWKVTGADGLVDNRADLAVYQVSDPPAIVPTLVTDTNDTHQSEDPYVGATVENVLMGSYITVRVKTAAEYSATVIAVNTANGSTLTATPVADPSGDTLYRIFVENTGDIQLTVAYNRASELYTAHIHGETFRGDPANSQNSALWDDQSNWKRNVAPGTPLTGEILVAPGYYIYSVTATGASGAYSYTLGGNGYNNGMGTYGSGTGVPINILTTMPGEDLDVTVTFRRGIPPQEPANVLTLTVKDDDNTETTTADNWAIATALKEIPTGSDTVIGPAGLGTTGGGALTASDYVNAGRVVEVEFSADTGYYVSSITVGPSHLGVELEWVASNKVRFLMPPASAGVTVEFKKGKTPTYFLQAYRTENGASLTVVNPQSDNRLTNVDSPTIRDFMMGGVYPATNQTNPETLPNSQTSGGTGAAAAGEQVTVNFLAKSGWYVHSVVVATPQSAWTVPFTVVSGPNDGTAETTCSASFIMPASDTEFIVNYRQEPKPDNPDYAANLIVRDRDNVDDPATGFRQQDNWVRGTYTSATLGTTHPATPDTLGVLRDRQMGVIYPQGGDTVRLDYQLYPGFNIDYIAVTPSGGLQRIYPTYGLETAGTDGAGNDVRFGSATFTMPGADVTVVVNIVRGPQRQYTANLILRPPAGVDITLVGQGTFALPTTGTLDNYPNEAIYSLLTSAGQPIDINLFAKDGYYIRAITIDPATGATATLSGSFGRQDGSFVMPPADVNVNVWFEKKWPDEVEYALTLEVIDPSFNAENYAAFRTAGGRALDNAHVVGNNSKTLAYAAKDKEEVVVDIHADTGFHVSSRNIRITNSAGETIPWRYVPGEGGGQAIAFIMPPMSTKITVTFLRDKEDPDPPRTDYTATLHLSGKAAGDTAVLAHGTTSVNADNDFIPDLRAGDTLTLDLSKPGSGVVAAAYAVGSTSGQQLMLPITLTPDGGSASFAMLEENADVYVVYRDDTPGDNDRRMNLVVGGPVGSGSAEMVQDAQTTNLIDVDAPGADILWVPEQETVTVTLSPAAGYAIAALSVTDGTGADHNYDWISMVPSSAPGINPVTWEQNLLRQITLTVPPTGGTVYVRYEKLPETLPTYTAQIVVNDEAYSSPKNIPSRNNAWFPNDANAALREKLREAYPGQWIDLSLSVHEGYEIEYIKVVPQEYGLAPSLALPPTRSQSTGFVMPNGNVTVYVKFKTDGLTRQRAYLEVKGAYNPPANPGEPVNEATISSNYSGTEGPIHSGDPQVLVYALTDDEWVTVDYTWDSKSSVKSITVKDASGVDVPFTQVTPGQITFPMAARDVTVTVEYRDDPKPVGYEVYLHVIDQSGGEIDKETEGYARLVYDPDASYNAPAAGSGADTDKVEALPRNTANPWGNTVGPILVPAGKLVDLTAFSGLDENDGSQIYIQSAYVLYEAGGQMIKCDLDPDTDDSTTPPTVLKTFTGEKNDQFAVHPGRNDVYVTLTKVEPQTLDYSAVLMLKGVDGDTSSVATICVGDEYQTATRRDLVHTNVGHGYVTATQGEGLTVSVTCPGYVIDRVVVTPLGDPANPIIYWTNNTGKFTMPGQNVAVTIYLRESNERTHKATLHYVQQGTANSIRDTDIAGGGNRGDLFWTPDGSVSPTSIRTHADDPSTTADESTDSMDVAENATVTLTTTLDGGYTVLAAYVLRGTVLVPLSPALEETVENDSVDTNIDKVDGAATFIMPGGDVDVYLVVTDDPPPQPNWHTAVLLVTDKRANAENVGKNYADIEKTNPITATERAITGTDDDPVAPKMGHEFITVWEGDPVRVTVGDAQPGYSFDRPATISHARTSVVNPLNELYTSPYVYEYIVGDYNSAVHVHFAGAEAERNNLNIAINDWDNPGNKTVTNPGNKTVTNAVNAAPDAMTPLELESTSSAGAFQVIPGVEEGTAVTITAKPDLKPDNPNERYHVYATYYDVNAPTPVILPLTAQPDGNYTGSITMPSVEATVTVHFYLDHKATLELVDLAATDPTSQAQMTEDFRNGVAYVHQTNPRSTLYDLPRGTKLAANLTHLPATSYLQAALLTTQGGTTYLSPDPVDGVDYYRHAMGRSDATITLIVRDTTKPTYVAAVETKRQPAGCPDPTITASSEGATGGSIWTTADASATVTTTITVPDGYKAVVTAVRRDTGADLNFTTGGNRVELTASGNVQLTMPAANVLLTVEYVKTRFTLTVQVGGLEYAATATATPAGGAALTHTQSAVVAEGTRVDVSAIPKTDDHLVMAYYRTDDGGYHPLSAALAKNVSYTGDFEMPDHDTTLYLIFAPEGSTPDPDEDYFIALTATEGDDGLPNNQVLSIQNLTHSNLPEASPAWHAGLQNDQMKVSFTTEPGWTAKVTAATQGGVSLPVVQQGLTGDCNATVLMPGGTNIIITVHYQHVEPPTEPDLNIALRLVNHDEQLYNRATLRTTDSANLPGLTTSGADVANLTDSADPKSPVMVEGGPVTRGERLTVLADWETGYQIVRITVAIPVMPGTGNDATGNYLETEVPVSRYGTKGTSQLYVPDVTDPAGLGRIPIVTVYYANIYTATLHIVGATALDHTEMTDNRTDPVSSTGTVPVTNTGDRLLQLAGGETIQTTAQPANNRELRGVVYESDVTGAQAVPLASGSSDRHDFPMPTADTDVYVYYDDEDKPEDEKTYIAKVALDAKSQGYGLTSGAATNRVTIENDSDSTASHGKFWTGAKSGETVTITVELIPGYQAEIISAKVDDLTKRPSPETNFDYYVTRTRFVVSGKTSTFQMPAATDATVTIRYIRGYDLTLEVVDNSALPTNEAALTTGDGRVLMGTNPSATAATEPTYPNGDTLHGLAAGTSVTTNTFSDDPNVETRVTWTTPFGGTRVVSWDAIAGYSDYDMPNENVVESVLFRDERKEDNLLAKVELKGESDIFGHGDAVNIVDKTDREERPSRIPTSEGTIWTTAVGNDTIKVTLRVVKGYVAKIIVRRDDAAYDANPTDPSAWNLLSATGHNFVLNGNLVTSATGEFSVAFTPGTSGNTAMDPYLSDEQVFTFTMPASAALPGDVDDDVTVLIEYVYAGTIPAPYDPRHVSAYPLADGTTENRMPNVAVAQLKEGFIYGENRGDYAVVEIPTLRDDTTGGLFNTDQYDSADNNTCVTFHFYLHDQTTGVYTELDLNRDLEVVPYDLDTLRSPTDPYNYEPPLYTVPDGTEYVGSKFILKPKEGATGLTTNGQKLQDILDNLGSLNADTHTTRLYVTAMDVTGAESAYTELWIRPTYTLALRVVSWGPGHPLAASLAPGMTDDQLTALGKTWDENDPDLYDWPAALQTELEPLEGESEQWQQVVRIRTSELLGDYRTEGQAGVQVTYALRLEKVSNIPYTRVNIVLAADETNGQYFYQAMDGAVVKRTFSIQDVVTLIAGDADGDGLTKWQDYELIRRYVEHVERWSNSLKEKPSDYDTSSRSKQLWDASVYNPDSQAYRCDLNSDGVISIADLGVLTIVENYNKSAQSYNWNGAMPHGMKAPNYAGATILLALWDDFTELSDWPDFLVCDDPLDLPQTTPPELLAQRAETGSSAGKPVYRDETPEIPAGEEVLVPFDPGEVVELPPILEVSVENPAFLPPSTGKYKEEEEEVPLP